MCRANTIKNIYGTLERLRCRFVNSDVIFHFLVLQKVVRRTRHDHHKLRLTAFSQLHPDILLVLHSDGIARGENNLAPGETKMVALDFELKYGACFFDESRKKW